MNLKSVTLPNPPRAKVLKPEQIAALPFRARKDYAHRLTSEALRDSRLRQPCSECGAAGKRAHHEDYNKPLTVVFLCQTHHLMRHAELLGKQIRVENTSSRSMKANPAKALELASDTCTDKTCEICLGTGFEQDQFLVGKQMQIARAAAGMTLKSVSEKMGKSEGYVSDLERARRTWTLSLVVAYVAALDGTRTPKAKSKAKPAPVKTNARGKR